MKKKYQDPNSTKELTLYGSSWTVENQNTKKIHNFLWLLPHDTRRLFWINLFPKFYWTILSSHHDLEQTFQDPKKLDLIYGIESFHKNKCIFVNIPNCAGVSIFESIFGNLGGEHPPSVRIDVHPVKWNSKRIPEGA